MNVNAELFSDIVRKENVIVWNVKRKSVILGKVQREIVNLRSIRKENVKNVNQRNVQEGNVKKNVNLRNVRKGSVRKNVSQRNQNPWNVRKGNLRKGNVGLWNVKKELVSLRNVSPRNVSKEIGKMSFNTGHLLLFLLLLLVGGGDAVRITQLEVPKMALAGDDIHLGCHYEEEGDGGGLYTLKWYKDEREFFRHQPGISLAATSARCQSDPHYHVPGVTVDCWASTERQVVLKGVSSASSGNYECEVIGDHPKFRKETKYSHLTVYNEMLLPPDLTQGPDPDPTTASAKSPATATATATATVAAASAFVCAARNTEYTPSLSWLINGRSADQSWVRQVGVKETALEVPVRGEHFPGGVMRVECLASLGAQHTQVAQLQLQQDHLSAQEFQYNGALSGQKTGVGLLVVLPAVLLWPPHPWH